MKIGQYETHPAADAFPMMDDRELGELAADIRERGLEEDIVLLERKILDGRNRAKACEIARVKPRFVPFKGRDPIAFVVSVNLRRRHLNESQRAMVAARLANLEQGQRVKTGKFAGLPQSEAGAALKVSERSVRHARTVLERAVPEVVNQVDAGTMAVSTAAELAAKPVDTQRAVAKQLAGKEARPGHARAMIRQHERRAVVRKINNAEVRPVAAAGGGPYRVLLADVPWPYENSDGHKGSRGHIPYPPMSVEAIKMLRREIEPLIHPDGCILAFWTTNAFLEVTPAVIAAWDFRWRTMLTWTKNKQGTGTWPRGRTEHCVIASRGNPVHTLNEVSTWLADRELAVREHSRKPDELYEVLEKHCPGSKLELFARAPRPNWAQWGAEVGKFKAAS